jgi:hypothetical protein
MRRQQRAGSPNRRRCRSDEKRALRAPGRPLRNGLHSSSTVSVAGRAGGRTESSSSSIALSPSVVRCVGKEVVRSLLVG